MFIEIEIRFQLGYNFVCLQDKEYSSNKVQTLKNLPVGVRAKVVAVHGNSAITKRLMEMGVVPGVELRVVKSAPFGDPLEIRVRGYHLAMRRSEADAIEVSDEK